MARLLFVDACVRGERSRTLKLARRFLEAYRRAHPEDEIVERDLMEERLEPQYPEVLAERDALWEAGRLEEPMFAPARQFAAADKIVLAAPFWDLSYPAILKIYLERISVTNITFGYDESGRSVGLCRAEKLLFITTRGGDFSRPETSWMESGGGHIRALCAMYGIPSFQLLCAEGLDDVRNDKDALMARALDRAAVLGAEF
ncbi:NAD(P)H-dependent oxidoreductase [uncultured Intestinimonas sp.]|uniref:FMN-dependent NADH-azoreductase n=1 Tax=uncultured Intestinimonas sp. TaxID=1689265 RepID=UPI0025DE6336|nr:NAD(P)H-dependent oxidoreductase [uncultured Intestinimonas sp.]